MNFEERLDRLAERHEALSQTVELIAHLHVDYEKKNQIQHEKNQIQFEKNQIQLEKNQILMAQLMESVNSLARIAHPHEQRITDLERPS